MKTQIKLSITTFLALAVLASCGSKDNKTKLEELRKQQSELAAEIKKLEDEISKTEPKKLNEIQVTVSEITVKPFYHFIDVQGKVTSDNYIMVIPKAPGVTTKVLVTRGQSVSKGQVLALIDNAELLKQIETIKPNLELATQAYNKVKSLWEQKIGTEMQYLQAKAQKESLEKNLASLLETNERFKIKAPISGIIDEASLKEGDMANPVMPAFKISNGSSFKATAEISESYIANVKKGNKASITFPDINESETKNIDIVGDAINPINRSFNVEVNLGASNKYKANMITFFKIQDYVNQSAIIAPINLIQHSETEGDHIFVAENGKAVKRLVKVGKTYGNEAEILEGLKAGDKIITVGYQELTDGQAIKF